ncbi:hypothetical protein BC830DRAFT_441281 [Chytriomyces sp. MP71]|nr:hypothetical protein BC830DRAFT_441281 [Chytriomyces sp. MP71]
MGILGDSQKKDEKGLSSRFNQGGKRPPQISTIFISVPQSPDTPNHFQMTPGFDQELLELLLVGLITPQIPESLDHVSANNAGAEGLLGLGLSWGLENASTVTLDHRFMIPQNLTDTFWIDQQYEAASRDLSPLLPHVAAFNSNNPPPSSGLKSADSHHPRASSRTDAIARDSSPSWKGLKAIHPAQQNKRFKCTSCEKAYNSKNGLKYHVRLHALDSTSEGIRR